MQEETKPAIWTTRLQDHSVSGQPIRSWCAVNGVTVLQLKRIADSHLIG